MTGKTTKRFDIGGEVGGSTPLERSDGNSYTVEWSGFRPFNVENLSAGQDVRAVSKAESFNEKFSVGLDKRLGSAAKNANNKDLKNVGPSVQYKLRDKTGQAREYQNYMQPVAVDGTTVFLAGMRVNPSDPFSYLRIPADDNYSVNEWMRLRAALQDPALRQQAATRYAARAMPQAGAEALRGQLQESAAKSLGIFAGNGKRAFPRHLTFPGNIPAAGKKSGRIFMKILMAALGLVAAARAQDGLKAIEAMTSTAVSCSWPRMRCPTASSMARPCICSWTTLRKSRRPCCR